MKKTNTKETDPRRLLAQYAGSIARFLAIHHLTVDATAHPNKVEADLAMFDAWLAAQQRKESNAPR